jgi:hypothetical protein
MDQPHEDVMNQPIAEHYAGLSSADELAAVRGVLTQHADGAFLVGDPSAEELARHIVAKLDPEPDMETVPLQALLETVGTFLEVGQAVRIAGNDAGTTEVRVYALGREFYVPTYEASEALTNAHELAPYDAGAAE